jgi:IS605 OrfB family transposase
MSKVTRIICSSGLNRRKYDELATQARLLGNVRREVWHRFGSFNGVGKNHRQIRSSWVKHRDFSPLPAKAWKETLRDALDDIKLYEEAAKKKVKKAIFARTKDPVEHKRLFGLLTCDKWTLDPYLCRMMRKAKKHGRSKVENQIVLEYGVYSQFTGKEGDTWLKVPSFTRGHPVAVPLNSKIALKGCLRLILRNGIVEVHHTIEKTHSKKCGNLILGVDKGYSEAFADSAGNFYGQGFGKILSEFSDKNKKRGQARNKLLQILKKKPHKAKNIKKFNLGRKKLASNLSHQKKLIRNIAFQSVHKVVDLAKEIRAEDLTRPIKNDSKWKNYNRRMSSWAKGALAEALSSVSKARGSRLRLVNCAYTSQMDSRTRMLEGKRVGDKFYHVNGDVTHADTNAAVNIEHRGDDTDITQYMSHQTVKKILLDRLTAVGGVSKSSNTCNRPSRTLVARTKVISTESELPGNHKSVESIRSA